MDEKYTDTTTKIVFDVLNDPPSQKYVVTQYKQKDAEPYLPVKAIVKDRTNITTISTNGELLKKQLLGGRMSIKQQDSPEWWRNISVFITRLKKCSQWTQAQCLPEWAII
jgi:hypothetical protein